jgi:hypothetical protein
VRNLLVHKGGNGDKEYREQIAGISDAVQLQDNEKFPMTGAICARLSDSCAYCAMWLVNAVHAWILGNPEKPDGDKK